MNQSTAPSPIVAPRIERTHCIALLSRLPSTDGSGGRPRRPPSPSRPIGALRATLLVKQRKRPQRHAGRRVLQSRVAAALRVDAADAAQHRDVLLAVSLTRP